MSYSLGRYHVTTKITHKVSTVITVQWLTSSISIIIIITSIPAGIPLNCDLGRLKSRDESNPPGSRFGDKERELFDSGDVGNEDMSGP